MKNPVNKSYYIVKKAMSPGVAALLSAGVGGGIGYAIDSWRASNGYEPENRWIGPLLMAAVASAPAITYGIARHSYDKGPNGEHGIPLFKRWLMNDKDFWEASPFAAPNVMASLKERESMLPFKFQLERKGHTFPDTDRWFLKKSDFPVLGNIPVNDFNQEVWLDASRGRTPLSAAGIVTNTLNSTANRVGSNFVTPGQVINTMVNAGIGYGTAWLAGKTLGALAGVSPATQQKLQEIGTWGGILGGIGNATSHF